jgi:Flp pilus assembly protein TadD
MRRRTIPLTLVAALVWASGPAAEPPVDREQAYRASNRGVALLEQFRHDDAAKAFGRALELDPKLLLARINLAIALYNVPDLPGAEREATAALAAGEAPQPHYILGLIARSQSRVDEAEAHFRKVLEADPLDVGALVNVGQVRMQRRQFAEAAAQFRAAVEAEPYNTTAVYNLGLALTRSGQVDEGRRTMERFQALREAGYGTVLGQTYPDQGHYAEALPSTGAEADLVDPKTPAVRFVDATGHTLPPPAAEGDETPPAASAAPLFPAVLFDWDGDGDLDLFDLRPRSQRLYRYDGARMVDATREARLDPAAGGAGALAADFDTDGRVDLLVFGPQGLRLLRNGENGFADVTGASGLPAGIGSVGAAAFADFDHDGDVDLFLGSRPGASRLFRNAGSGVFADATAAAGLSAEAATIGLVPTDFDNRRDMDLLQVAKDQAPRLFRNLRDGTFRDVAADSKLPAAAAYSAVAAGDVNKDGFTDFFFGIAGAPDVLALSDGKTRFVPSPAPSSSSGTTAAQFLDYDNDGLLDLVAVSPRGARALRNLGSSWADVTANAMPEAARVAGAAFASGDVDGDGDTDLVLRLPSKALRVWRNDGGEKSRSLAVHLAGRVSNRSGVGAKVEVYAGSLRQKLETSAATPPVAPVDVVFGLGRREQADAVRVLWPSGTLQTELVEPEASARRAAARLEVKELDRKPSSCPYLYAWDGSRFQFVTDFMGGSEMGYWVGPGAYNHADPDEYVRLSDAQLVPRDGRYEIRVTNELEEVLFADRFSLLAVDHAADVEVYPNEGMVSPMPTFRLYTVRGLRPPASAVDDHGHDVLERLLRVDRLFPDDFGLHRIRGYADEHTLTLDLGAEADVILLTGWTDYAFSSDTVAAHQAGLAMHPPELQAQDERGAWKTVMTIGIPVGRPQTVLVNLAGKWLGPSRMVRIVTNMRIYWDEARTGVAVNDADARLQEVPLSPLRMDLRERGFSAEVTADGHDRLSFDYQRVSWQSPWKLVPGRYTRPGDVRELLETTDDLFVISRPGDEIALSFAALPPPAAGRRRTFLLYADGFSKEMDINSATPDAIGPLPFHGMSRYPYAPPEAYPMTEARREVLERYTTRIVRSPLPPLETTREARVPGPSAPETAR